MDEADTAVWQIRDLLHLNAALFGQKSHVCELGSGVGANQDLPRDPAQQNPGCLPHPGLDQIHVTDAVFAADLLHRCLPSPGRRTVLRFEHRPVADNVFRDRGELCVDGVKERHRYVGGSKVLIELGPMKVPRPEQVLVKNGSGHQAGDS